MKRQFFLICFCIILFGCSKTEDGFNDANPDAVEKLIKKLVVIYDNESFSYTVNYDPDKKVTSISDGSSSAFLSYSTNNSLNSVTHKNETFNMSELYQAPYDAFDVGSVLEYDDKGNPILIEVYENGYGSEILLGEIIYDKNPNPFFYTLKAAGLIDVLDRVELNFGFSNPVISKARQLLPFNSIKSMIFRDYDGITRSEVHIDYDYDIDGYPKNAIVSYLSSTESGVYNIYYHYLE